MKDHTYFIHSVAFSPDGRFALTGSLDKTVRLWDLTTGECVRVLEGHGSIFTLSPDGRYAMTGIDDHIIRLWDLKTGACVHTLEGHTSGVKSIAFSPDGRFALTGSLDKTVRLWDLTTGECVRVLEGHGDAVHSVAFSPDGRFALTGSYNKTVRLWEFDWEYDFPEEVEWDDGARPYLDAFLTLHTPYAGDGISRKGAPQWTEEDFQRLMNDLSLRGYGWIREKGVKGKLEELATQRRERGRLGASFREEKGSSGRGNYVSKEEARVFSVGEAIWWRFFGLRERW